LAPPPVPPKMPPIPVAPGVDDDIPAQLRNTGHRPVAPTVPMLGADDDLPPQLRMTARNRAAVVPGANAPGVDDDLPAYLRNTAQTRGIQSPMPVPSSDGAKKKDSSGISFAAAIVSMAITLLAGLAAGWIIHARLSGVSPLEIPAGTTTKR
jgi:hypothetical protein